MRRTTVERAIDGDHDAFAELVTASTNHLYKVARLILRDSETARDAVQEAFALAWRDIRALRDPDAWEGWLHRLTVRSCYKLAKKERHRRRVEIHVEPDPLRARTPDPAAALVERDRLEGELAKLDVDRRAILVLHFYADLTLEQTAHALDIPIGTAKSRLHRTLATLRASMADDVPASPGLPQEHPA